jgi:hypothetical protein
MTKQPTTVQHASSEISPCLAYGAGGGPFSISLPEELQDRRVNVLLVFNVHLSIVHKIQSLCIDMGFGLAVFLKFCCKVDTSEIITPRAHNLWKL